MKNVLFLFLLISKGLFSQNSDKAFTCDEVTFWQSQLASQFSSMTLSPEKTEDTYTSTRFPNGFEKAIYEKTIIKDVTDDTYSDLSQANGKDSIQQKYTRIKASKTFETESEAKAYLNNVSKTLEKCLKSKGFKMESWSNTTNEGNRFFNQTEEATKILYSEIQISIEQIADGKTIMFTDNVVGFSVEFDWTYSDSMFY
ncbi:MAG: hypothetical protein IT221_12915 [Fluviicola sp.]|nr:hypothetical protein [Fluviicola sp.]